MATTTTTSAVIHSIKIILMSTGVLFIAILVTPQIFNLTAAQLPAIWSSLRSWLRPPYLYVIINGIIITIAASSRLHNHQKHPVPASPTADTQSRYIHHDDHYHSSAVAVGAYTFPAQQAVASVPDPVPDPVPEVSPVAVRARQPTPEIEQFGEPYDADVENHGPAEVMYDETEMSDDEVEEDKVEEKAMVLKEDAPEMATDDDFAPIGGGSKESLAMAWTKMLTTTSPPPPPPAPLARQETSEIVSSFFQSQIEKPPPSARFGNHRRPTRATPEGGKALRVAKPRRNETLESTWKTITEGRHMPLTRHLKKSDTWDHHNRQAASSDPAKPSPVKKSETFSDRSSATTRLKKEASLGQDELNRRVEAFIKKVNEDMRLQRQQSIQQYQDMIDRAAY